MDWTSNEQRFLADFDAALKQREEGMLDEALELLRGLIDRLSPDDRRLLLHCHLQCGYIYSLLGDATSRETHFRSAVKVAPRSELASLALFHTLFSNDKREEALEEMVRYVTLKDSNEYRDLLSGGGFDEDLPPTQRALANNARRLLSMHAARN